MDNVEQQKIVEMQGRWCNQCLEDINWLVAVVEGRDKILSDMQQDSFAFNRGYQLAKRLIGNIIADWIYGGITTKQMMEHIAVLPDEKYESPKIEEVKEEKDKPSKDIDKHLPEVNAHNYWVGENVVIEQDIES